MKVLIRTDSSLTLGTGHLMRCLTLADYLRRDGAQVRFVCKDLPGNLAGLLSGKGFAVSMLPAAADAPHAEWQDPEWRSDAEETSGALPDPQHGVDWMIVDNYAMAAPWESRMRAVARRIMVIDDLANRPHDCDLLLDQNLNVDLDSRYDRLLPAGSHRLLGPRYALLRPEFSPLRQTLGPRDGRIRRVLISFGGTDPGNETGKAVRALQSLERNDVAADVVAGAANPNFDALATLCARLPQGRLHRHVANMAQLMADADLAIGAPGSTTWERCCLGLPSILISLATNQESVARALAAGGYAIYLGKSDRVGSDSIRANLQELLGDPGRVVSLGQASAGLVDGEGVARVAAFMSAVRRNEDSLSGTVPAKPR